MTTTHPPTDLQLLELRAESRGDDIVGLRGVRLLCRHLVAGIREHLPGSSSAAAELDVCERLLTEAGCDAQRDISLVYVIESEPVFTSDATIQRSDQPTPRWLRAANPGGWNPVEWNELLDGCLGPWTMAVDGHRVVSICHTPVPLTDEAAECGVWTDRAFRGRGYAAAVTAQWAALLRPSGRHLFYSTDAKNLSSQRVAERLQLRLLGYHCELREVSEEHNDRVHPLSQARSSPATPASTSARTEPELARRGSGSTDAIARTPGQIPPIETPRLSLHSMSTQLLAALAEGRIDDAQALVGYEIPLDFSLLNKASTIAHRLALIEADPSQHPWLYRAIVRKVDGRWVGHISFHHKAPDPDLRAYVEIGAELGYGIETAYRRSGFGKESAIAMMTWASECFDVRSFILSISPRNVPSLRMAESMGFDVVAEQHDPRDGLELVMRADIDRILRRT